MSRCAHSARPVTYPRVPSEAIPLIQILGLAFVLAQGAAFLVYCLIVLAVLIVLRLQGHSLDGWLDRILLRDSG